MGSWWPEDRSLRAVLFFSLIVLLMSLSANFLSPDHLFEWNLKATAEKENIVVERFERGPFSFDLEGQQYIITEAFGISKISHQKVVSLVVLSIVWLGFTGFLAFTTFLKRYAFLFFAALFLLYVNQLYLDDLSLLEPDTWKWTSALLMLSLLAPAYFFHAFKTQKGFLIRWLSIFGISSLVLIFYQILDDSFYLYFTGQSTVAFSIATVFFVFLVAEEIVFLIVYFITRSTGGSNNEKHFFVFSIAYLLYLGLYWADRMGLVGGSWDYLNPYFLLIVSTLVGFYTLRHKQPLLDSMISSVLDIRWLMATLLLLTFGFILLTDVRGNDASADAIDYIILYAHLGFGIMFVLYITVNLITPLIQGLMIHKVIYKEHNFPYITSRLAGFIFVVAFYFYAEQAPLRRSQSARLNYLGDYYSTIEPNLGRSYYQESAVFGWDNHYASIKLAEIALDEGDLSEAIYRYTRAVSRNPSPYAYVGGANAMVEAEELTRAATFLRQGLRDFPENAELSNNLALLLDGSGATTEALSLLSASTSTEKWNQAVTVNQLAIGGSEDFDALGDWNLQVLSNWQALANKGLIASNPDFMTSVGATNYGLPLITYLVNSGWGEKRDIPDSLIASLSRSITNRELNRNLRHAEAYNLVLAGSVNQAIPLWEQLIQSVNTQEKGFYFRQLGNVYMRLHAPLLARDAFEKAVEYGSQEAKVSFAIASMEAKDWSTAIEMWEQVTLFDSSYSDLIDLTEMLSEPMIMPSFAWLYYNLPEDLGLYDVFSELPQNQIQMLWDKLFVHWSSGKHQNDLAILTDRVRSKLTEEQQLKYDEYQAFLQNPSALTVSSAGMNAFDLWKIILILNKEEVSIETKYELLLSAISVNKYQVDLIVQYAQYAIDMGVYDYAESATLRLLTLVSPERYQEIERMLFDRRQKREESLDDWSI